MTARTKFLAITLAIQGCNASTKHTLRTPQGSVEAALTHTPAKQELAIKVSQIVSRMYGEDGFHGAILLAQNGEVHFGNAFGLADWEWNVPNTANTQFRIGSLTKAFTAILILQSVERGELHLDGTISDYLPYYRTDIGEQVTVHHLLSHTSGIPEYLGELFADPNRLKRAYEPKDFVEQFCSNDLSSQPGEQFAYSNSGYFILGAILEAVTQRSYAELVSERIFRPAGMENSSYENPEIIKLHRARGYQLGQNGYQNAPYFDLSIPYAAGALSSCIDDLLAFDQALYSEELLTEASIAKLFSPVTENYGYGWEIREMEFPDEPKPVTIVGPAGSPFGFHANLIRAPAKGTLAVVLSNTQPAQVRELADQLMLLIHDND